MSNPARIAELLNLARLTAPHFLAYEWVVKRIAESKIESPRVLDVGSRYSLLPTILALGGCRVVASDRDAAVVNYQRSHAKEYGVQFDAMPWEPKHGFEPGLQFDFITACWAIQHNEPHEQAVIAKQLADGLATGGSLLVVSSFRKEGTIHQTDRPDPQWVLDAEGHSEYVIFPSGLKCVRRDYFKYEHGTTNGGRCAPCHANATVYQLRKEKVAS